MIDLRPNAGLGFAPHNATLTPHPLPTPHPQCPVVDGCVSAQKMRNFLHNKFIPGRDNIATEWLPDNGHMFKATCSLTTLLSDMRSYLLTRPLDAVTAVRLIAAVRCSPHRVGTRQRLIAILLRSSSNMEPLF